jgi:hypothetical protein
MRAVGRRAGICPSVRSQGGADINQNGDYGCIDGFCGTLLNAQLRPIISSKALAEVKNHVTK